MEIGDQRIQHLKVIARIDEDICPACAGCQLSALPCPAFNGPAGGGAYADHPSPSLLRLIDDIRSFLWDQAIFRMHFVLVQVFRFYWAERSQAHMDGHKAELDTHAL